jgi:hypothetical protein
MSVERRYKLIPVFIKVIYLRDPYALEYSSSVFNLDTRWTLGKEKNFLTLGRKSYPNYSVFQVVVQSL